jgi:hypothetical protein
MSSATAMRLAPLGNAAANIYNSYHFVSQVAGLYAHAAQFAHRPHVGEVWMEISILVVGDIEELYGIWQKAHELEITDDDNEEFGEFILKTCSQVEKLVSLMDVWTPIVKWTNIMRVIESRYRTVLTRFIGFNSPYTEAYSKLLEGSKVRDQKLNALLHLYQNEAEKFENPNKANEQIKVSPEVEGEKETVKKAVKKPIKKKSKVAIKEEEEIEIEFEGE